MDQLCVSDIKLPINAQRIHTYSEDNEFQVIDFFVERFELTKALVIFKRSHFKKRSSPPLIKRMFRRFHHFIYEYTIGDNPKSDCSLLYTKAKCFDGMKMDYFSVSMLNRALNNNPNCAELYVFKEKEDSEIIGFSVVCFKGAREIHYKISKTDAFISALEVFPSARGKGYSQKILSKIENICRSKGMANIKLAVDWNNDVAIKSYEKFGFKKVKDIKFFRVMKIDFLFDKKI